jgi:glycosyltransferase involved in cell wall biosynthesis
MRTPVSVIIPCYGNASTIARAVGSVVAQTLPPEEILLVDDCSNDGGATLDALHRLPQTFPQANLRIIALAENAGPGGARNAAWEQAMQPYIAFLDADDAWHPRKLDIQYSWMAAHPEIVLSGHQTLHLAPNTPFPDLGMTTTARPVGRLALLLSNRFPTRTVMLKRDLPWRFDHEKRRAEDYLLWLRIVLGGRSASTIDLPLACSFKEDFGSGGLSAALWKMERGELDTYCRLRQEGYLSVVAQVLLSLFSLAKFLRRRILRYNSPFETD